MDGQQLIDSVNDAVASGADLKKYDNNMNKKDVSKSSHTMPGFRRDGVNFFSPSSYDRDIEYMEVLIRPLHITSPVSYSTKHEDTRFTYHLEKDKLDDFLNNFYG